MEYSTGIFEVSTDFLNYGPHHTISSKQSSHIPVSPQATQLHSKFPIHSFPRQCSNSPPQLTLSRSLHLFTAATTPITITTTKNHLNNSLCIPNKSLAIPPLPLPRPKRIILIRHGQSKGNVNEYEYTKVPDPKIELTEKGLREAEECGQKIKNLIQTDGVDDWQIYFYVSPYKRTLDTLRGLGKAFDSSRIAGVREEPRLREQDFGNFQDREKRRLDKAMRIHYGRFFYRFPDGESAADVYDRITGFRETLRHDIEIGRFQPPGQQSPNMNLIIVSHGLTLRVFLMRWYKWTVEQFEGLNNFCNGGMIVMQQGYGGRYSLVVHHSPEELKEFGLTDAILADQEWQSMQNQVSLTMIGQLLDRHSSPISTTMLRLNTTLTLGMECWC